MVTIAFRALRRGTWRVARLRQRLRSRPQFLTNVSRRMKRNYEDIAPANWVIPSNCIAWEREIGSGAFATTYEVRYDGQLMAAKKMTITVESEREAAVKRCGREFQALNRLSCPNIIRVLGVVTDDPRSVTLLMELVPRGSLRQVIDRAPNEIIGKPAVQLALARGIAVGMDCLHSLDPPMLHCDLNLKNVLAAVGRDGRLLPKIADFGISRGTGMTATHTSTRGTAPPAYRAPELFARDPEPTTKSEVYSFGICAWELLTGRVAWAEEGDPFNIAVLVRNDERPVIPPAEAEAELAKLAQRCWLADPTRRPTFRQLLNEWESRPPELALA